MNLRYNVPQFELFFFLLFFNKQLPHAEHARVQLFADFVTLLVFNEDLFEYGATVFSGANGIISPSKSPVFGERKFV